MILQAEEVELIQDQLELMKVFNDIELRCFKLQNFEQPGMKVEEMIGKLQGPVLHSVQKFKLFSPNQKLKEIHTEILKFLSLPYFIGWLYGRSLVPRRANIETSRNYLSTFLEILDNYNSEDEEIFPPVLLKIWRQQSKEASYRPPREELIQAMKQKKLVENRYKNSDKIKDEGDQRQAIKDFLTLQIHESIASLRCIEQQINILNYKDSIEKDPETKARHQEEMSKPIPKITVTKIPAKEHIHQCMASSEKRKDIVAQVWLQNANKPTMTLEEVGDLQYQNMVDRQERQKKEREANKQDSDSDKQQVDDREKKKARAWDDWKDDHEKGAGNRNGK